jgi:glycosyltransferase involved in cell wall biosynthesis
MKIYNIIENLDDTYGGPAKSVPYLCKYLNDLNIETEILSVAFHNSEKNSVVQKYGLDWKSFKFNFSKKFRYSKDLKNYLENELKAQKDKTILHIQSPWNYIPFISHKMAKKYSIPLVVSIRGSLYKWSLSQSRLQKKVAWSLFQKRVLQNANIIHVTEKGELEAVRDLGIKTPIAIIPNGINLDEFSSLKDKAEAKKSLGLDMNKNYILFMSRLHPKKGLEYLVKAWTELADKFKNWDLLIVGPDYDKDYTNKIFNSIKEKKLYYRVHIMGMLEGQKRLDTFASSSLFVLPSHTENFGIVIAEAMASKLPVITTKGTPWQEINKYNAGWWVELNQTNIYNSLLEALNLNKDDLAKKGKNGYELIKKYHWKYQAQKMKKLYEYIL